MADKIEEVKEYLKLHTREGDCSCPEHQAWLDRTAKEIYQLFEPKNAKGKSQDV